MAQVKMGLKDRLEQRVRPANKVPPQKKDSKNMKRKTVKLSSYQAQRAHQVKLVQKVLPDQLDLKATQALKDPAD